MAKHIEFFAEQIKFHRRKLGLSQEDLADNTGLSLTLVKDIERRKANPTMGTIIKIANFFEVSVAELLDVDDSLDDSEQIMDDIMDELRQLPPKKLRTVRLLIRVASM